MSPVHHDVFATMIKLLKPVSSCHLSALPLPLVLLRLLVLSALPLPLVLLRLLDSVGAKDVSSTGWFALAEFRRLQWILKPDTKIGSRWCAPAGSTCSHRPPLDPGPCTTVKIIMWSGAKAGSFHDQGRPIFLARLRLDTALPSIGKTKL